MGLPRILLPLAFVALGLRYLPLVSGGLNDSAASRCRIMPGDPEWPDSSTWDAFNTSVDGRLVRTMPLASVCHGEEYDQAQCEIVRSQWHRPTFHEPSSSSYMAPVFLNQSCDPFTAMDFQCIIGNYIQYAVNVSKVDHVVKTVKFAKKHNIRFVVRNTGHDYMGKSTGAGGLAVWMHHLTERTWYSEYESSDSDYHGSAVKVAAGVLGDMLAEDAEQRGLVVVAGECPTVGFVGGYIQGGGHSTLSSLYGMAADQALAFEVITTDGRFVRASQTSNSDLFWALRGGGGGTYGIVWSVTVKAYPDMPTTNVRVLYLPSSSDTSLSAHWEGIQAFFTESPKYLEAGGFHATFFDNTIFNMVIVLPKMTPAEAETLTAPWLKALEKLDIDLKISSIVQYPTVRDAGGVVNDIFGGEVLTGVGLYGARVLPKYLWETEQSRAKLYETWRGLANDGVLFLDIAVNPTREVSGNPDNAVLPAIRSMHSMCILTLPWNDTASWDDQFAVTKRLTDLTQRLESITPDTGAYLNEANAFDPNWKINFYGENYDKLLEIKDKWDPEEMLYGTTAVGGDRWVAGADGRLCRRANLDNNVHVEL